MHRILAHDRLTCQSMSSSTVLSVLGCIQLLLLPSGSTLFGRLNSWAILTSLLRVLTGVPSSWHRVGAVSVIWGSINDRRDHWGLLLSYKPYLQLSPKPNLYPQPSFKTEVSKISRNQMTDDHCENWVSTSTTNTTANPYHYVQRSKCPPPAVSLWTDCSHYILLHGGPLSNEKKIFLDSKLRHLLQTVSCYYPVFMACTVTCH